MFDTDIRIGDKLRLPFWETCFFLVIDVGLHSFWGNIIDPKEMRIVAVQEIQPKGLQWIRYEEPPTAAQVISHLKMKESGHGA